MAETIKRTAATMQAGFHEMYGDDDVIQVGQVPVPEMADDRVLVRVRVAGTHMGDWHLMTGLPYLVRAMGFGLRAPKGRVRGTDFSGTVEAVGEHVTEFQPGDEVFGVCGGSFAEYAVARPDKIVRKPPEVSFEQAASLPTSGVTAIQALRDAAQVRAGQKVLVIGAGGGVGSFTVQLAKMFGTDVTGVCSTGKVELVRSLGADAVIDYTQTDGLGEQYDVIIDTAGNRPLSLLRRHLTRDGALVLVGAEGGGRLIGLVTRILRAKLLSPFVWHRMPWMVAAERPDDMATLADLVTDGKLEPVIDRTYPLSEAPAAMAYLSTGHAAGKTVIAI